MLATEQDSQVLERGRRSSLFEPSNQGSIETEQMDDNDWDTLLSRIESQRCTPFIGGDACPGMDQLHQQLVQQLIAKSKEKFPFAGSNLSRAAQFIKVMNEPLLPYETVADAYEHTLTPHRTGIYDPYVVLADLPFPVYMTTNYHNFMEQALKQRSLPRNAKSEFCRWKEELERHPPSILGPSSNYMPDAANPLVFHLYGQLIHDGQKREQSLVLTEDDYFDLLINISQDIEHTRENRAVIPSCLDEYFSNASLLFLGYRVFDSDFLILLRIIKMFTHGTLGRRYLVAVQAEPSARQTTVAERQSVRHYFEQYLHNFQIQVYWGNCQDFVAELSARWKEREATHSP